MIGYHANCIDGKFAAYIAHLATGMDYFPLNHNEPIPSGITLLVDFSCKTPCDVTKIIDHHETCPDHLDGVDIIKDKAECGATLVWKHFFPDQDAPEILKYVRDRDLWLGEFEETDKISAFLSLLTIEEIGAHLNDINFFLQNAEFVYRFKLKMIDEIMFTSENGSPFVCQYSIASDVAHRALEAGANIAICRTSPDKYSVRSKNGEALVLAKLYGGGGHPNAAGYNLKK